MITAHRRRKADQKLEIYYFIFPLYTAYDGVRLDDKYVEVHAYDIEDAKLKMNSKYGHKRWSRFFNPEEWESIKSGFTHFHTIRESSDTRRIFVIKDELGSTISWDSDTHKSPKKVGKKHRDTIS